MNLSSSSGVFLETTSRQPSLTTLSLIGRTPCQPQGWHGVRPINERVVKDGCLLVVSKKKPEELLKFIGKKPYNYRLAILDGDASLAGLWVNKDDLTHERILGGIAAIDPAVIRIEAVEAYLLE